MPPSPQVLSEPSLAKLAGQDSLVEVEREVLTSMVDDRLTKLEDAAQLIRSFNYLMLRLCENCNKTAVFGCVGRECVGVRTLVASYPSLSGEFLLM